MSNLDLSQPEADVLLAMKKIKINDNRHHYPHQGGTLRIPLTSEDKREEFMLDITRGRIELSKGTLQNRARKIFILARLDYGGSPHRNPDGEEISSPHLHIYREGFGDKWATQVPSDRFPNINDYWRTLQDFMKFCNIIDHPKITGD
jgi:hypothetical protein